MHLIAKLMATLRPRINRAYPARRKVLVGGCIVIVVVCAVAGTRAWQTIVRLQYMRSAFLRTELAILTFAEKHLRFPKHAQELFDCGILVRHNDGRVLLHDSESEITMFNLLEIGCADAPDDLVVSNDRLVNRHNGLPVYVLRWRSGENTQSSSEIDRSNVNMYEALLEFRSTAEHRPDS